MNSHSGITSSVWMSTAVLPQFPLLTTELYADVCVIGAGIAGLSTAYQLGRAGHAVVVIDGGPVASGETERTTAHLSNALDDRYCELERIHGESGIRLAADSHTAAIDTIERIVREEGIDCEFSRVDGYLFNAPGQPTDLLDRELAAAHVAGLQDVEMVERAPLVSFNTGRALLFPRQAQFHPLKYMAALAQAVVRQGGRIYADTRATAIQGGAAPRVETAGGPVISCQAIVVATNTPIDDRIAMHTRQAAYRTYVIGAAVPVGTIPQVLYWDTADPYHYVRLQPATADSPRPPRDVLIVGGEDHRTGQTNDAGERFARLEEWTRARFPMAGAVPFRWSGQVMESVDGLAYIGRNPLGGANVYIATGDSGDGMTHGTIAGLLLTDLILDRPNRWAALYDPARIEAASAGELLRENLNMAAQYLDWLTAGEQEKAELLRRGSGAVVRSGLEKIAVYRDEEGRIHECSAVCPHLRGIVRWNDAEKTWDCPVHGSRFDCHGHVIHGPAKTDLRPAGIQAR